MRRVMTVLCAITWSAGAIAQLDVVPVADTTDLAVGVVFERTSAQQPGVLRLVAECRLLQARAAAPSVRAVRLRADAACACVVGVFAAGDRAGLAAFTAALFAPRCVLDDDALAVVVARAALAADDQSTLYPGDLLWLRAERALAGAAAECPDAESLAALTPATVRRLCADPQASAVTLFGAVDAACEAAVAPVVPGRVRQAAPPSFAAVPAAEAAPQTHARCDSPWVSFAYPLPADIDRTALAVGLEVARARAARRLRPRGAEAGARAPFVAWSWLDGDRLVRLHRRAIDPVQLLPGEVPRGDAAGALAGARAELTALVVDLRDRAPGADEVQLAIARLGSECGLVRPRGAVDADRLAGLAVFGLLRTRRGIDGTVLAAVTPAAAHVALRTVLAGDRAFVQALLPEPRADMHWPR